jgi:hypothetical protein
MKKNDALMTRARRIDPVPAEAFQNLAQSSEGQEVLDLILQTTAQTRPTQASPLRGEPRSLAGRKAPPPGRRLHSMGVRVAVVAGVAAVVLGIIAVGTFDSPRPDGRSVWAAELVRIAEDSPRLLIGEEGWTVTGVDEFSGETGAVMFARGRSWVELSWRPADEHASYFQGWKHGAEASWKITIAGHEAVLFRRKGPTPPGFPHVLTAMWLNGEHSMELRSDVIQTADEFRAIAATLHFVDVETWLSAMPAGVVKPDEREDAIARILANLPVPTNVDMEELRKSETVSKGYTLEYVVMEAVVCGWVQQWIDGIKTDDKAAVREAVDAMASRQWAVLDGDGQFSSFISDVADAMPTGSPVNGDTSIPIGVGYQRHLGCPEGRADR